MLLECKAGDVIQKREEILKGRVLMHNFSSLEKAQAAIPNAFGFFNLSPDARLGVGEDVDNPGMFAVIADEDTYLTTTARVNWVVGEEAGVTYENTSANAILNLEEEGWIVVESAKPMYQSDVANLTDEELRASIEALRSNRIARPASARSARVVAPKMSEEDKKIRKALGALSSEKQAELMKRLGMGE